MKSKQILAILLFVIAIGLLIWWFTAGHHSWTTTQTMIEVKSTDELFGTSVTTQKWVDDFTPGLLPFSNMSAGSQASGLLNTVYSIIGLLGIGLLSFLFVATGALLLFLNRRKAKASI
jgi:hypothetical protein